MNSVSPNSLSTNRDVEVTLDGIPIAVPAKRRSLNGIRLYLETLAMERQRILCSLAVDGQPADLAAPLVNGHPFIRVEAESLELEEMPSQLIAVALQQTAHAREQLQAAVVLVLINDGQIGREHWWHLAKDLKAPLITLSLVPEAICGPCGGSASLTKLRKWQLQQLAAIIKDVDEACWSEDVNVLSNALENRALPWLDNLQASLELWQNTLQAGARAEFGAD